MLQKGERNRLSSLEKRTALVLPRKAQAAGYKYVYYFDALLGDDANDGSKLRPKRSLEEASRLIGSSGSAAFLFRRGRKYSGNLRIEGCQATKDMPLLIGAYGRGTYPIFEGEGSVIQILESNVVVSSLEVTGENALRGIHITPCRPGIMENIFIENCYVHDINWHWTRREDPIEVSPETIDPESVCPEFEEDGLTHGRYFYRYHGGIIAHNEVGPSCFWNIVIRDNIVKNVARTGITIYNKWTDQPGVGYGYNHWNGYAAERNFDTGVGCFMSDRLICDGNYLECIGGDGIVLSSATNVRMTRNVCYAASYLGRKGYWNAGIWVYNVKGCRFEDNECGYTFRLHGAEDGQGFDLDNCCQDVLFRHNIAHHNQGGGLLCCNLATKVDGFDEKQQGMWGNNLIHENYFFHNGDPLDPTRSAMLTIARQTNNAFFSNNLVVLDPNIEGQSIVHTEDESTFTYGDAFNKNVFACMSPTKSCFTTKMMKESLWRNNRFYHVSPRGQGCEIMTEFPQIYDLGESLSSFGSVFERRRMALDRKKMVMQFIKGGFSL